MIGSNGYVRQLGQLVLTGPAGTRTIIAEACVEGCLAYIVIPVSGLSPADAREVAGCVLARLNAALGPAVGDVPQLQVSRPAEARVRVAPETLLRRGREWFNNEPWLFPPADNDVFFTPPGQRAELEVGRAHRRHHRHHPHAPQAAVPDVEEQIAVEVGRAHRRHHRHHPHAPQAAVPDVEEQIAVEVGRAHRRHHRHHPHAPQAAADVEEEQLVSVGNVWFANRDYDDDEDPEIGGVPDLRTYDTEGEGYDLSRRTRLPNVNMRGGARP